MPRPSVDVVVPFRGEAARLDELRAGLARLQVLPGDSLRLRAAGWEVERREAAKVVHRSRQTVRGFIAQKLLHGVVPVELIAYEFGRSLRNERPGGTRLKAKP